MSEETLEQLWGEPSPLWALLLREEREETQALQERVLAQASLTLKEEGHPPALRSALGEVRKYLKHGHAAEARQRVFNVSEQLANQGDHTPESVALLDVLFNDLDAL